MLIRQFHTHRDATVAPGAHAVLLVDQAGWHLSDRLIVPANITLIDRRNPAGAERRVGGVAKSFACAAGGKATEGVQRARYMTLETIAPLSDDVAVSLPSLAA